MVNRWCSMSTSRNEIIISFICRFTRKKEACVLKTECPDCKIWVYSPFLNESDNTVCPDCGKNFPVGELFVSAGPFAIYREVLQKNMHKYTRLLGEAKKELESLSSLKGMGKPYEETASTVRKFIANLEELLEGCREGLRVHAGDIGVDYVLNDTVMKARLVNISITGICLDVGENVARLGKGQVITLAIKDPAIPDGFRLVGEVVWSGKGTQTGVRFLDLDNDEKRVLKDYVMEKNRKP